MAFGESLQRTLTSMFAPPAPALQPGRRPETDLPPGFFDPGGALSGIVEGDDPFGVQFPKDVGLGKGKLSPLLKLLSGIRFSAFSGDSAFSIGGQGRQGGDNREAISALLRKMMEQQDSGAPEPITLSQDPSTNQHATSMVPDVGGGGGGFSRVFDTFGGGSSAVLDTLGSLLPGGR